MDPFAGASRFLSPLWFKKQVHAIQIAESSCVVDHPVDLCFEVGIQQNKNRHLLTDPQGTGRSHEKDMYEVNKTETLPKPPEKWLRPQNVATRKEASKHQTNREMKEHQTRRRRIRRLGKPGSNVRLTGQGFTR